MYVKSHVSCGDSAREKKSRVASVKNIHTTCSQLLDRYNYQCCFSLLLCAGGSEAWFQTRDYPVFDQVAFLQGPMTCGFAVCVAAAAVAAAELATAAAADAGPSGAFQIEPPFLPGP